MWPSIALIFFLIQNLTLVQSGLVLVKLPQPAGIIGTSHHAQLTHRTLHKRRSALPFTTHRQLTSAPPVQASGGTTSQHLGRICYKACLCSLLLRESMLLRLGRSIGLPSLLDTSRWLSLECPPSSLGPRLQLPLPHQNSTPTCFLFSVPQMGGKVTSDSSGWALTLVPLPSLFSWFAQFLSLPFCPSVWAPRSLTGYRFPSHDELSVLPSY